MTNRQPHMLFTMALVLLSLGCEKSGPTAPSPVGGDGPGPGSATGSGSSTATALADQIQGTFIGHFQNPTMEITEYRIVVTRIDDTTVQISPASGGVSSTFLANLTSMVSGSVTSITLQAPSDILLHNGTFVATTGRLSYSYHLGGDARDIEVFSGTKQ